MKLPKNSISPDLVTKLSEFDIWITPTMGEIRDTERFKQELASIIAVFDALAETTDGFGSIKNCSAEAITEALLKLIAHKDIDEASTTLLGAASLLFLTTGKSDNNAKCQLPLYLRDKAKWVASFPVVKRSKGRLELDKGSVPRVLPADRYMALVASLAHYPEDRKRLLLEFVRFVLSDDKYVAQLWSVGHSYIRMKEYKHEQELLTPLVIFQVRGSVSATGGHEPEDRLRSFLKELGLLPGVDYNTTDVIVSDNKLLPAARENSGNDDKKSTNEADADAKKRKVKTRAYDFVLPFHTPGWSQRIFIQSQFYAGDSGSVSHKNVDQTSTSRAKVLQYYKDPLFLEYVDGAGYFSSLNGDLKSLLSMDNTHDFVQVRSTPIRLRRALQAIGFLTPLEIEHAICRTNGSRISVLSLLKSEGYTDTEINRSILIAKEIEFIQDNSDTLSLKQERRPFLRRMFLLDTIACNGHILKGNAEAGYLLIPGYGPFYGMKLVDLLDASTKLAPALADDFSNSKTLLDDIQWLEEQKFAIAS